jgi:hypothetical protein
LYIKTFFIQFVDPETHWNLKNDFSRAWSPFSSFSASGQHLPQNGFGTHDKKGSRCTGEIINGVCI